MYKVKRYVETAAEYEFLEVTPHKVTIPFHSIDHHMWCRDANRTHRASYRKWSIKKPKT